MGLKQWWGEQDCPQRPSGAAGVQGQQRCDGLSPARSPSRQRSRWEGGPGQSGGGTGGSAVAWAGSGAPPSVGGTWAVLRSIISSLGAPSLVTEHQCRARERHPQSRSVVPIPPFAVSPLGAGGGEEALPEGPKPLGWEAGSSKNNRLPGLSSRRRACV